VALPQSRVDLLDESGRGVGFIWTGYSYLTGAACSCNILSLLMRSVTDIRHRSCASLRPSLSSAPSTVHIDRMLARRARWAWNAAWMAFVLISSSEFELLLAELDERERVVGDEDDWREGDFSAAGAWQ